MPGGRVGIKAGTVALALGLHGAGTACQADADGDQVRVFAASSLTEAFAELEREFEREHPGAVDVLVTFAGSQTLRTQIEHGASADVFASANPRHLESLVATGVMDPAAPFAANELVVIVPSGSTSIQSFEDLQRARRLVIGTPDVPVGAYTDQLLTLAERSLGIAATDRIRAAVVSRESNVRLVRAKVELGEADAAIVYRTDAIASTRVRAIELPPELRVRATYAIAAPPHARPWARRFLEFARSPRGRAILERHGFSPLDR